MWYCSFESKEPYNHRTGMQHFMERPRETWVISFLQLRARYTPRLDFYENQLLIGPRLSDFSPLCQIKRSKWSKAKNTSSDLDVVSVPVTKQVALMPWKLYKLKIFTMEENWTGYGRQKLYWLHKGKTEHLKCLTELVIQSSLHIITSTFPR